jgi:hypothetical protein
MRHIFGLLLAMALVGSSTLSWAASSSSSSPAAEVGYGAGAALGTLVYVPFKATFCILGGIGSAFTAIVSPPTAGKVASASCRGTWVITPDVVEGRDTVKFVGDTSSPDRAAAAR